MKRGNWVIRLVFGILGGIYMVLSAGFLGYAIYASGDVSRIFTLPEEELVFAVLGTVFAALGGIFLLAAGIILLIARRRKRLREELLAYGARTTGVVTEVFVDHTVRVNGRSPYRVMVRCMLPLGEVTLRSPMLWRNVPAVGDEVTILYDRMNERRRMIELADEGE